MSKDKNSVGTGAEEDVAEVWDALEDASAEFADVRRRKDRQLNLRVDDDLLTSLREAASQSGEGYHTFARRLVEEGIARTLAQANAAEDPAPLRMKEVMLVLLGAGGSSAEPSESIAGRTRLQKLLFLAAQHLQPHVSARFEAYDFGPFDEAIQSDVEFLAEQGLINATGRETLPEVKAHDPERGPRILEWVRQRNSEVSDAAIDEYRLTHAGMEWVRRFLASDHWGDPEVKRRLFEECRTLRDRFGRVPLEELVDYVYAEYPNFTAQSKIRHQVAERLARKAERE
jgi:predicted DNA binding CopG/RHH family protein